jgi:hypothetical protein
MRGKMFSEDIITTGISLKVDDSCLKLKLSIKFHQHYYKQKSGKMNYDKEFEP